MRHATCRIRPLRRDRRFLRRTGRRFDREIDADGGASPVTRYFSQDPTELGLSVSAMVWREREILLMRRADNGHWGLPGGFVELGESVSAAARREVAEETGWKVEIEGLIGVYSDPGHQVVDYGVDAEGEPRRVQVVNLCFHARAVEPGEPTTPQETLEIGFFAASELPSPFVPIHEVRVRDGLAGRAEAAIR
jgi:ADP-ribose pyrophosphatase YjhB (NUDIX family)